MSKRYVLLAVGMLSIAVSSEGCGGTPAAPTGPATTSTSVATIRSIAIAPDTAVLKLGVAQQFSVTVELSPGAPPSGPPPVWVSQDPSVVVVNSSGVVTGIAPGRGVVQVMFRGHTGSRQLEVVR